MLTIASLLNVSAFGLKISSYAIVGALLIEGKVPEALWGILIAQVGSVLINYFNRRADLKQREQTHQWDKEDREARAQEVKAELAKSQGVVSSQIENVGRRADQAYDAGNHVSEKVAALATRPVIVTLPDDTVIAASTKKEL